jgi:hypothetical protein
MAEFTLKDIGYGDPEAGGAPMSLQDMGYDVTSTASGQKVPPPESRGASLEEEQAIRDYINSQPDPRSWGQYLSDAASNVGDAVSAIAPKALGGKGSFYISDVPGAIASGVKEGVAAPGRLMRGEVEMFDAAGNVRPEAIGEGMKFGSVILPGGTGGPLSMARHTMPLTERAGRRRIAEAIEADQRQGKIRGIAPNTRSQYGPRALPGAQPEQLSALDAAGVPVSGYDLSGGPNVKRLVETSSDKAHDTAHATALQQDIATRSANGGQYVANTIDNIAGRPLQTGPEFEAAVNAIRDTNGINYPSVMSMPEHQSVFSPRLKGILEERDIFRRTLRERAESVTNAGRQAPPIYGPRGQLDITPTNAPSLEYLNDVYIAVRDKASAAYDAGNTTLGRDLKAAANDLRNELDNLSAKDADGNSTYKSIRDDASELFGARNALEAGYKYLTQSNPLKMDEINRAISSYTPDQVRMLQTGLLSRLKDEVLKPNGLSKVTSYFDGSNLPMQDKITRILGADETTRLGNQMRLQKIVNETQAPVLSPEAAAKAGGISPSLAIGLGGAGVLAAEKVLENAPAILNASSGAISGTVIAGVAAAGAAYGLKKIIGAARNAYEARVAQSVLDAITTRDPAAFAALERMPPGAVRSVLDKVAQFSPNAAIGAAGEAGDSPDGGVTITERPGRKAGGRVGSNPISAEIKKVRTLLSHKTATMLSMPDDAVATALHIAKGHT